MSVSLSLIKAEWEQLPAFPLATPPWQSLRAKAPVPLVRHGASVEIVDEGKTIANHLEKLFLFQGGIGERCEYVSAQCLECIQFLVAEKGLDVRCLAEETRGKLDELNQVG